MASFKSNPIYFSLLGLCGLAVAGAGWGIYSQHAAAEKSATSLAQKRDELNGLLLLNPAPTKANEAAVEADLNRTEIALGKMREELKGRGPVAEGLRKATAPSEPTDVFFNIETFVEKMRQKAQAGENKIKLKPDERFGFYTYKQTGPDRDMIPQVFRQRLVAEYLIDALFEAKPSELVSVTRERPLTKAAQAAIEAGQPAPAATSAPSSANSTTENDFFDIDPRISARVPGFVGASAFRLTFISETETLRALLNRLASFELPLVVRSVEVEAVPKAPSTGAATVQANSLSSIFGNTTSTTTPAVPAPAKPLVERTLSKFTVTVELIDLVETLATEATPTS